jgi:hypothetical protein
MEHVKDIISVGCDPMKTFIYPVTKYVGEDIGFKMNWRKVSNVCLAHTPFLVNESLLMEHRVPVFAGCPYIVASHLKV